LCTLFAVAEEKVAATSGTEIAYENVGGAKAGTEKLGAIGFAEVEEDVLGRRLVAGRHHVEPLDGIGFVAGAEFVEPIGGFGELGKELGGDLGADFVAATTDGGANGGEEVGGLDFEVHLHLADGFDHDAGQGAAPAGMNGSNGAFFRVDEENRNTIGGLGAQEKPAAVGGGGISAARFGGRGVKKMDNVGMDLLERNELEIGRSEGGLEAAAVFEDVFFGVPFGEAEIENFFAVLIGDSARLSAEAVGEPGEFGERSRLQDSDTLHVAFDPVRAVGRDRQRCLSHGGTFAVLAFGLQCFRGSHNLPSIILSERH
jgi:hypothetical protein